ncbi:MAG: LPS-assembly protein LptD [Bdellovibrionales bacterium]
MFRKTLFTLLFAAWALSAHAQQKFMNSEEGFFFIADRVEFNEQTNVMTASGNVEITNSNHVVKADKLVYDVNAKRIIASGNVAEIEPTGDILFADEADLTDDFGNGFARNVSLLLADNSRMTGRAAQRRTSADGVETMDLAQATYSPCNLCVEDPDKPPLWQVRADRVNHSMETHDVTYEDAWLEFGGVKTLYMPQFSHPDPTVKRRTGFLTPTFGYGTTIGTFVKVPYYMDVAPNLDVTLTPTFSEYDSVQMLGEVRKRWHDSRLDLEGSIVQAELTEENGVVRQDQLRGHVRGEFKHEIDEYWRSGADVYWASDKTYLDRYRYRNSTDVLTNRAYLEGFNRRDYAAAEMFYFQDTRPGVRLSQPYVLPRLRAETYGNPSGLGQGIGGRWKLGAEVLQLERPKDKLDTKHVSSYTGWERTDIFPVGLVSTVNLDARVDGYLTSNYTNPTSLTVEEETNRLRGFPSAQLTLRYPLTRQFGSVQQTIEPIVAAFAAPVLSDRDIPNEDSADFEFDHTNLFRANRFTGVDRLEGGPRVTYGVRTGVYGFGGGSASAFLGQSHRFRRDTDFAQNSGLFKQTSDYVGRVTLDPAPWLFFDYNFRVDQTSLQPRKHDARVALGSTPLRFEANYLFLDDRAGTITGLSSEELAASMTYAFTDYWSAFVAQKRIFQPDSLPIATTIGVNYADECFNFGFMVTRDHTVRTGVENGTSFFLRLILKNLGGIETPVNAGNVFNDDERR